MNIDIVFEIIKTNNFKCNFEKYTNFNIPKKFVPTINHELFSIYYDEVSNIIGFKVLFNGFVLQNNKKIETKTIGYVPIISDEKLLLSGFEINCESKDYNIFKKEKIEFKAVNKSKIKIDFKNITFTESYFENIDNNSLLLLHNHYLRKKLEYNIFFSLLNNFELLSKKYDNKFITSLKSNNIDDFSMTNDYSEQQLIKIEILSKENILSKFSFEQLKNKDSIIEIFNEINKNSIVKSFIKSNIQKCINELEYSERIFKKHKFSFLQLNKENIEREFNFNNLIFKITKII